MARRDQDMVGHFRLLVYGHGQKGIKSLSFLLGMNSVLGKAG
jgi:hypothetical protein